MSRFLTYARSTDSRGVIRFWTIAVILVLTVLVFRYPSIYQSFVGWFWHQFQTGVQHPHGLGVGPGAPTTTVAHHAQHIHHVAKP